MRAIRFEQRYNFKMDPETTFLLTKAMKQKMLEKITIERFKEEFFLLLDEPQPIKAIERMEHFGILKFVHPKIRLTPELKRILSQIEHLLNWFEFLFLKKEVKKTTLYLLALLTSLKKEEAILLSRRFKLNKTFLELVRKTKENEKEILEEIGKPRVKKSVLYRTLTSYPYETLLYLMAKTKKEKVKKRFSFFFTHLAELKLEINGDELIKLGFKKGPHLGKILNLILAEKIDGKIKNKKDEIKLAQKLLKNLKTPKKS
jgi:tRNA nucleotidyltransferase (CCA-adding enzyme)